jgi:hypothetical protein
VFIHWIDTIKSIVHCFLSLSLSLFCMSATLSSSSLPSHRFVINHPSSSSSSYARVCVCACVLSPDYSAKPCLIRFSNILFYCYTTATIIEFSLFSSSFLLSLCVCVFNSLVFPLFHTLCFWNSTTTTTIFYLFVGFFHWHTHTHTHTFVGMRSFLLVVCLFVCFGPSFFRSFFFVYAGRAFSRARVCLFFFLSFFFRYLSCSWRFPLSFFFLAKDDKEEKKKITTTKEINSNDFLVHRFSADVIL